jgi:hypothetical protein
MAERSGLSLFPEWIAPDGDDFIFQFQVRSLSDESGDGFVKASELKEITELPELFHIVRRDF